MKFQADIDLHKRAGELSEEEVEKIVTIMQNPRQYKIPNWFLNRQKDIKDGKIYILFFSSFIKPNYIKMQLFIYHFYLDGLLHQHLLLTNGSFPTISSHFFANCMNIFHKTEVQTVILRF